MSSKGNLQPDGDYDPGNDVYDESKPSPTSTNTSDENEAFVVVNNPPDQPAGGTSTGESMKPPPRAKGNRNQTQSASGKKKATRKQPPPSPAAAARNSSSASNAEVVLIHATRQLAGQDSPDRMKITAEEKRQALQIKQAIESTPDLDGLSDMMYCQIAILGEGNIEWAINKAYQLASFKEQWGILDTLEDAIRHIPPIVKDRFVLSVDLDLQPDTGGGYIIAYDTPQFDWTIFKSTDRIRTVMTINYYLPHLMSPDFCAVRAGVTSLFECQGFKFKFGTNFELNATKMMGQGGWSAYPMRHRSLKFFNTSMLFNVMMSMVKAALAVEVGSKFQTGCKFPAGRLDRMYNIPSEEVAVARLCQKLEKLMRRRYENEKNFSLDDAAVVEDEPAIGSSNPS